MVYPEAALSLTTVCSSLTSAWSMSAIKSSKSSMPTERRIWCEIHRRGGRRRPALFRGWRHGVHGDEAPGTQRRAWSSLHRGGTATAAEASLAEAEVAVRAARALGLGVAGIELVPLKPRPAGAGGQFLAGHGGHRGGDRRRYPPSAIIGSIAARVEPLRKQRVKAGRALRSVVDRRYAEE